jgi:hypothetical protein
MYGTGTYSRNEEELDKVRYSHGKALVDSILEPEALIREKLGYNVSLNQ